MERDVTQSELNEMALNMKEIADGYNDAMAAIRARGIAGEVATPQEAIDYLADALDAEREKVEELKQEGIQLFEWRLALHSLTPGGSEFCTPEACESWVRKSKASQHEHIIEQIKQRKELQAQLTQLQALVRALSAAKTTDSFHRTLSALESATLDATTPATPTHNGGA